MDRSKINYLKDISNKVRHDILLMSYLAQSAHVGGALSCVEILVSLYYEIMNVDPKKPMDSKRDRLVFSKGHDAKAVYAVLASKGYFDKAILEGYEQDNGILPGHTTRFCVPGVEYSSGSLGHGLPIACGVALAAKKRKLSNMVYCIQSDGECDEGTTWETALFAAHHKLHNLILIIDYNNLQGFGYVPDVLTLEPLSNKWKSFGWNVKTVDGHSFPKLTNVFKSIQDERSRPTVVIAKTIKGFGGVTKHINQISSQYKSPTKEEFVALFNKEP